MFLEIEDVWFERSDNGKSILLLAFDPWKGPQPDERRTVSIGGALFDLVFRLSIKGHPVFEAVLTTPQSLPQAEQVRLSPLLGPCSGMVKVGN